MIDKSKILSENKKRNAELFAPYDPFLGIGSPVQRHKFVFDSKFELFGISGGKEKGKGEEEMRKMWFALMTQHINGHSSDDGGESGGGERERKRTF